MKPTRMIAGICGTDDGGRRADRRRERVRRGDARDADDDGADEADRAGAQALVATGHPAALAVVRRQRRRGACDAVIVDSPSARRACAARRSWEPGSSCSIFAAVEPRNSRRGCASRLEPTSASSPGCQLEMLARRLRCCRRGRRRPRRQSSAGKGLREPARGPGRRGRAPATRIAPVSTLGRQIDRHEREQPQPAPVACASRRRLFEQCVGAGPGADGDGDAGDPGSGVDASRPLAARAPPARRTSAAVPLPRCRGGGAHAGRRWPRRRRCTRRRTRRPQRTRPSANDSANRTLGATREARRETAALAAASHVLACSSR